MKKLSSILILTNDGQGELIDIILRLGYQPCIRDKIETVLHDIKHKRFDIILLDVHNMQIDALEFLYNVRDIDALLPVVIINGHVEGQDILSKENNVILVSKNQDHISAILSKYTHK